MGFSVYWVMHSRVLVSEYLGPLDSLFTLCSLLFIPAINYSLNQEVKSCTGREKADQRQDEKEIIFNLLEGICKITNGLKLELETNVDARTTLSNVSNILSQEMENLKKHYDSIQQTREWLGDKEFLKEMSVKSGNYAFAQSSTPSFLGYFLDRINPSNIQKRKQVYQEIYDCFTWVKKSFYLGDYGKYDKLFADRIKNPELTVKALKWIRKEILLKKLEKEARRQLNIYFNKLIQQIEAAFT